MSETVDHPTLSIAHPPSLTVHYETNADGWVTAQIAEVPAAISQGRTEDEAWVNVLGALHDLAHPQTKAERIATTIQARVIEPVLVLLRRTA
ncbi:MAG TPA: hypothetical protein VGF91_22930 [Solirubrobacteraceae bacterium]|jgi:hypothetical protein